MTMLLRSRAIYFGVLCCMGSAVLAAMVSPANAESDASSVAVEQLTSHLRTQPLTEAVSREPFADVPLTRADADRAALVLWEGYAKSIRASRRQEMKASEIVIGELKMPFFIRKFGEKPAAGWSLYISMHGGGGAPKRVNDQQWENQKGLYQLKEGIYLVPRAPTNTWNLWHQKHIDDFFDRLITNLIVLEDVNPDRVYVMGYSAGGDGVYQLAPRMADRLAAAAMMAGHPNETSPLGLRNIGFTLHVGGRDAAYRRNEIAREWSVKLANLRKADPRGYRHLAKVYPNKGHWLDREDAVAVKWMSEFKREAFPERVVWKQDDVVHRRFYWLAVEETQLKPRTEIFASRNGQTVEIEKSDVSAVTLLLNDQVVNLDEDVIVRFKRSELFRGRVKRTIGNLARTTLDRGDPRLVFSGRVAVKIPAE